MYQKLNTTIIVFMFFYPVLIVSFSFSILCWEFKNRKHAVIKRLGLISDYFILGGLSIVMIADFCYFYTVTGNDILAAIYLFVQYSGVSLFYSGLFNKVYTLNKVFNSRKLTQVRIKKWKIMVFRFIPFVLIVVGYGISAIFDNDFVKEKIVTTEYIPAKYHSDTQKWDNPLAQDYIFYDLNANLFLTYGIPLIVVVQFSVVAYLTYMVRDIEYKAFDETIQIGHSLLLSILVPVTVEYTRILSHDINFTGIILTNVGGVAIFLVIYELYMPKLSRLIRAVVLNILF